MGVRLFPLAARCVAECLGTFILVFFGCGVVHAAKIAGAHNGLWQVASVWGVGIMVAIYIVGGISGAHINPAITVALAFWKQFSWRHVVPYVFAQLAGAFIAAAVLFALYYPLIEKKKAEVIDGKPGMEVTASCYGEYYWDISEPAAFAAEALGTALLALAVFALTDGRNVAAPLSRLAPVFIGLTVAILISVIAPLTQAGFNPARDFGPRLFAYFAGWGEIAIPGRNGTGFFTVYIVAPVVGAIAGGGLYLWVLRPALPQTE